MSEPELEKTVLIFHVYFEMQNEYFRKEGLDIPRLERLFLTTPQKDYAVITQSIGRIARISDGKREPVCYDFIDDIGYLVKAYKKRCTTYRKNGCYFIND